MGEEEEFIYILDDLIDTSEKAIIQARKDNNNRRLEWWKGYRKATLKIKKSFIDWAMTDESENDT